MRQYSPPKKERKKGKKGFSVHCGSAVAPGASRSLHCCSPLVCVLNLSGGLAVWWLYKQTNKLPTFPPFSWICTAKQTNSPFSKRWDSKRSPQKKSKLWMVNFLFPVQMSPSEKRQMMTILDSDFHSNDAALAHCLFLCSCSAYIYYCIRDDVKLAQFVRARDCQSRGRQFDSCKNSKNWELKSTWIRGT